MKEIDAKAEYTEDSYLMFERVLHERGKCCVCDRLLFPKSKHINIVTLNKVAEWNYPVWGNVLTDVPTIHASAVVCDSCIESNIQINGIRYAIEFDTETGKLTYHLVSRLKDKES